MGDGVRCNIEISRINILLILSLIVFWILFFVFKKHFQPELHLQVPLIEIIVSKNDKVVPVRSSKLNKSDIKTRNKIAAMPPETIISDELLETEANLIRHIEENSQDVISRVDLATLYLYEFKDSRKAAEYAESVLRENPDNSTLVAVMLENTTDDESTVSTIQKLEDLRQQYGSTSAISEGLAKLKAKQGNRVESEFYLNEAIQLGEAPPQVLRNELADYVSALN